MVLVGAFATAVIIAEDDVFAEDIQTKLTKKVDTTTKELEKDKINKACIEMDKFLQETNNLVEKDKLAQTDAERTMRHIAKAHKSKNKFECDSCGFRN